MVNLIGKWDPYGYVGKNIEDVVLDFINIFSKNNAPAHIHIAFRKACVDQSIVLNLIDFEYPSKAFEERLIEFACTYDGKVSMVNVDLSCTSANASIVLGEFKHRSHVEFLKMYKRFYGHQEEGVMSEKVNRHNAICKKLNDLYKRKNHDYGDSFGKSFKEWGLPMACIRIGDKVNRLGSLVKKKGDSWVADESLKDTLMDLANYAIMTLIELEETDDK